MLLVSYRGIALALSDLLGGQVQVSFASMPSSIQYIRAGTLRALAVVTATRSETMSLAAASSSSFAIVAFSLCDEDFAATCCVGAQLIREQLQAPPHKHSEKFRPVPPIASTIEHIGESRLGTRDRSCLRPAIGTQTPWHDIRWLRLSLGTSEAFPVRICKGSPGVCFTDQDDAIGRQFLRG